MKNYRVLFVLIMALIAVMLLSSCEGEGKTVVSKTLNNVPQVLYVEEFDPEMKNIEKAVNACNISIKVEYSDGTTETIPLTFDMLEDFYKQELNSEGRHYISYLYKGEKLDFNVYVQYQTVYTVRFLDLNGNVISEQKVEKGQPATEPTETERAVEGYEFIEWDHPFDRITRSIDVQGIYEKMIWVSFYNGKGELISTQYVYQNEDATEPDALSKYMPGYTFVRWDASFTNVQHDIDVYGIYIADTKTDVDGDGICDYIEIEILGYDHTSKDTDGNGVTDDKEDFDNDGLSNLNEIKAGLMLDNPDTDGDGLTDGEEVDVYWTLPNDPDTDGDGACDGWEVQNGSDPLVYNDSFEIKATVSMPDNSQVTIDVEISGENLNQPIVEASTNEAVMNVHGSIGEPIQYNISASAEITISSDELTNAEDPVLMYFNTETKQVEPIEVTVNGNEATASITTYGNYVLVDRKVFEEKGQWRDVFESGVYTSIEVVLVIDDSGSLGGDYGYNSSTGCFQGGNDPAHQRLTAAKVFIESATESVKIGIVKFDSSVSVVEELTQCTDSAKKTLQNCLNINNGIFDSKGTTYMYTGIDRAIDQFSSNSEDTLKIIIVFTDGIAHDSSKHSSVISEAKSKDIKIYTVGLGNFENSLESIAGETGGKSYDTDDAEELVDIFKDIKQNIDMTTDTDNDGIADFFESGEDKDGNPTLPTINGMNFVGLDKTNPDTDGDGYLDGEEIEIYLYYSDANPNRVMVWGIVNSDPTDADSVPASKKN